jgi:hypothetical protein
MKKLLVFGDTATWNLPGFRIENINPRIREDIKRAETVIYNLEGPIRWGDKQYRVGLRENPVQDTVIKFILWLTRNKQPTVFSDESILDLLTLNRNTIVTLANNHIKDLGYEGLIQTVGMLEANGIKHLGAGSNNSEASKALVIGDYAIINCNFVGSQKLGLKLRVYNATKRDYGSSYQTYEELRSRIRVNHHQRRRVILILHAGKEMPKHNNSIGIDLAKVKSLNADVSVIHHFHRYVPTHYENDNIYCLGDFLFCRRGRLPDDRESSYLEIDEKQTKVMKFRQDQCYPKIDTNETRADLS